MKRRLKDNVFFVLLLAILFFVLCVPIMLFVEAERKRNLLLAEYEVEKLASYLLESFNDEGTFAGDFAGYKIIGFGLYLGTGASLVNFGTAPAGIEAPASLSTGSRFRFNVESGTMALLRRIGF
ncbi:MAG: hypothetical protein AB1798_13645, partial [Spirochaetota bacterium]